MLFRDRLRAALEARAEAFVAFDAERSSTLDRLSDALTELASTGAEGIRRAIAHDPAPGALPTPEWDRGIRIPFGRTWEHHPAARAWALETLLDQPTFAADGSQIEPDGRFSVPAALVQVGWFENRHRASGPGYRKDVDLRVLGPEELAEDEIGPPKRKVDLARFELEVAALMRYLAEPSDGPRIAFFDGSLIASFAEKQQEDPFARRHVELVCRLLDLSAERRVPVVAYIDTSYARDLATMLATWKGLKGLSGLSDGALLSGRLAWGDRTPVAVCARPGILDRYGAWSRQLGFCYLQTNAEAPPARLEFPMWLVDEGRLERVLDVVRAEAIAGGGYPYTLASADATAVLTQADREAFYRILQEFLTERDLDLRFSKKALSKLRRR